MAASAITSYMTGDALLQLNDVSIERGGLTLASGISFEVRAGEAVVLRGPNGSGKTTLLRTIAGLQPPVCGTIETDPDAIAYGAHADGLKSTLSVTENLAFWAALYGHVDIERALKNFDLVELRDRQAGALSAGQKRRLGLARLVVTGRTIWALDEPTVSLDTASVALFANAIRQHLKSGGAAVLTTHIDLQIDAEVIEMSQFPPIQSSAPGAFDEALT